MEKIKILKFLFLALSFGLTLVSLNAGFFIYDSLFGTYTAFLTATVFEILRLSTLYSINIFSGFQKVISFLLYFVVAGICFFSAVLSFDSKTIAKFDKRNLEIQSQINKDVYLIRNKFSQQIEQEISAVLEHKDQMKQGLAKNPQSTYYPERIQQDDKEIEKIKNKRDEFFDSYTKSEDKNQWIQNYKAILGIDEIKDIYEDRFSPFQKAAKDLLGIDEIKLQKYLGYALGFGVEFGIILLAILGMSLKFPKEIKTKKENLEVPKNNIEIEKSSENIIEKKDKKQRGRPLIKKGKTIDSFFDE